MTEHAATGGWELTSYYAPAGTRCLAFGGTVYDEEPMTPDQMRAFAEKLVSTANTMDAKHEGEDHEGR